MTNHPRTGRTAGARRTAPGAGRRPVGYGVSQPRSSLLTAGIAT